MISDLETETNMLKPKGTWSGKDVDGFWASAVSRLVMGRGCFDQAGKGSQCLGENIMS